MDIHQPYFLAADVVFLPAETVPAGSQQHLTLEDTDVIITFKHTRKRSKVVNAEMADLLKRFQQPVTVTEAIFRQAQETKQDPQHVAEVAFPLLQVLQQEGYLVQENKKADDPEKKHLQGGEWFRQYEVKEVCQTYENSAVYKVADRTGKQYALKLFYPLALTQPTSDYLKEKAVLKSLDNIVNPLLVEYGEQEDLFYLVTEWCNGISCEEAAKKYRNLFLRKNALALLQLCINIGKAYQHLHSQGVLHGDVHPANVLVTDGGNVCLLDYGSAVLEGEQQRLVRGGVDFYYEPELATALLQEKGAVPMSPKSEQYAVAALLYRLLTGHPYLLFSYEPEKTYQQIAEEPPLPFSTFDTDLPAEVEEVIKKALSKNPDHRYHSLAAFTEALQKGLDTVEKSRRFFAGGKIINSEAVVQFLLQKYGSNDALIERGLRLPPTASVNYGAAGIAYFLYRAACVLEDPACLDTADVWVHHALGYEDDFDTAFYSVDEGITEKTVGRRALYHSPTGVHVVQAMVSSGRGDSFSLYNSVAGYLKAASVECLQLDLTLGKAGLLLGSALLLKELKTVNGMDSSGLLLFTNSLMQELWQQLDACPSIATEKEVGYYGIAHGWGGLLYATVLWCQTAGQPLPQRFTERMEALLMEARLHNGALQWPVSNGNKSSWLGWCHGNAGYIFLWGLLYQYFNEERFLTIAIQTGEALFNSKPQTANLCCGLAGEAYALLKLYQLTGEKRYLQQAEQMKQRILRDLSAADLRNHSLYKGETGIALFLCESTLPHMARMPLFE